MDSIEKLKECFDFVGVKGCKNCESDNVKMYVNALPGMSTELLDHIANSEQESFEGVVSDAQFMALLKLQELFETRLFEAGKYEPILYRSDPAFEFVGDSVFDPILEGAGAGQMIQSPYSENSSFIIESVNFCALDADPLGAIEIWDDVTNELLHTMPVEITQGINCVALDVDCFHIKRGLRSLSVVVSTISELKQVGECECYTKKNCSCKETVCSCACDNTHEELSTFPIKRDVLDAEEIENGYVCVKFSIECKIETMLCTWKDR